MDFRGDLPFNRTVGASWLAVMEPDCATTASIENVAYAIYTFSLLGYDEAPVIALDWAEPPADMNDCYLGLSHWESNSWHWYRPGADNRLDFASLFSLLDYFAPDGTCHLAVALTGEAPAWLSYVRIGERVGYWQTQAAYAGSRIAWPSMALDSKDQPQIACRDLDSEVLRYCRFDGLAWHSEMVGDFVGSGITPWLALDTAGRPHIAHQNDVLRTVSYTWLTGDGWQGRTVESGCAHDAYPVVVPGDGDPVSICYYRSESRQLKLAHGNPDSLVRSVIQDELTCGSRTTMAMDSAGRLHICYIDSSEDLVHYASFLGTVESETAVPLSEAGSYPYLALGPGDDVLIALRAGAPERVLWLVRRLPAAWDLGSFPAVEVSSLGPLALYCSLALDNAGTPHLAYADDTGTNLVWSSYQAGAWQSGIVDNCEVGPTTAILLDSAGRPVIAYVDAGDSFLHVARLLD